MHLYIRIIAGIVLMFHSLILINITHSDTSWEFDVCCIINEVFERTSRAPTFYIVDLFITIILGFYKSNHKSKILHVKF